MRWLWYSLTAILGLSLGAVIAQQVIQSYMGQLATENRNGQWQYFPSMDLGENVIQRAAIARNGLFAVRESEVLYVLLDQDENGNSLSSEHIYELAGVAPQARYWSLTLYGEDHFLIPNSEDRFSFNMTNLQYEDSVEQSFRIFIAADKQKGNWLPSGAGKSMSILLRMYHPDPVVYEHLATTPLPNLQRIE